MPEWSGGGTSFRSWYFRFSCGSPRRRIMGATPAQLIAWVSEARQRTLWLVADLDDDQLLGPRLRPGGRCRTACSPTRSWPARAERAGGPRARRRVPPGEGPDGGRVPGPDDLRDAGVPQGAIEGGGDRILGFTAFGPEAGEVMAVVQVAMLAGLPYTALRDAVRPTRRWPRGSPPCSRPCRRDDVQAARTSSGTGFVPQPRPSALTGPPRGRRNDRSAIRPGLSRPAPGRG